MIFSINLNVAVPVPYQKWLRRHLQRQPKQDIFYVTVSATWTNYRGMGLDACEFVYHHG